MDVVPAPDTWGFRLDCSCSLSSSRKRRVVHSHMKEKSYYANNKYIYNPKWWRVCSWNYFTLHEAWRGREAGRSSLDSRPMPYVRFI